MFDIHYFLQKEVDFSAVSTFHLPFTDYFCCGNMIFNG